MSVVTRPLTSASPGQQPEPLAPSEPTAPDREGTAVPDELEESFFEEVAPRARVHLVGAAERGAQVLGLPWEGGPSEAELLNADVVQWNLGTRIKPPEAPPEPDFTHPGHQVAAVMNGYGSQVVGRQVDDTGSTPYAAQVSGAFASGGAALSGQVESEQGVSGGGIFLSRIGLGGFASQSEQLADGSARHNGVGVSGWRDNLRIEPMHAFTTGGHTGSFSSGITGYADRFVADLGEYDGPHESLAGHRRVELRTMSGGGVQPSAGFISQLFGVGGGVAAERIRHVTFRTLLRPDVARDALFESKGVRGFLRDRVRAVHRATEKIPLPDLKRPETLRLGDEVVVRAQGSLGGSFAVGGLGPRVGMQALRRGDFEVAVRKLSDTEVEVIVTPTRIASSDVYVDTAVIVGVDRARTQAQSFRQGFVFDLSVPGALEQYRATLERELPGALPCVAERDPSVPAESWMSVVNEESLPDGVRRTVLERQALEVDSLSGGLKWGIIESVTGFAGLSMQRLSARGRRAVAEGDQVVSTTLRSVERYRERFLSGVEGFGIDAQVRHVTTLDDAGCALRSFGGVTVRARYRDSRVDTNEMDRAFLSKLNRALGTVVAAPETRGRKQSRSLEVSRNLSEGDLERISRARWDGVEAAAQSGVKHEHVRVFVNRMRYERTAEARAEVVQEFLAKEGLAGLGAIHRLLGGDCAALCVRAECETYEAPLHLASSLAFKYDLPFQAAEGARALLLRNRELERALRKVDEALCALNEETLLAAQDVAALKEGLTEARTALRRCLSVEHLSSEDAASLRQELAQGWRSGQKQRMLRQLGGLS